MVFHQSLKRDAKGEVAEFDIDPAADGGVRDPGLGRDPQAAGGEADVRRRHHGGDAAVRAHDHRAHVPDAAGAEPTGDRARHRGALAGRRRVTGELSGPKIVIATSTAVLPHRRLHDDRARRRQFADSDAGARVRGRRLDAGAGADADRQGACRFARSDPDDAAHRRRIADRRRHRRAGAHVLLGAGDFGVRHGEPVGSRQSVRRRGGAEPVAAAARHHRHARGDDDDLRRQFSLADRYRARRFLPCHPLRLGLRRAPLASRDRRCAGAVVPGRGSGSRRRSFFIRSSSISRWRSSTG